MDLLFPAMMNLHPDTVLFTVPLTEANHQVAQRFYAHHTDAYRAKHVYLNTLSVQAVQFYLQCMGILPQLDQGLCWNPVLQGLIDTADLWVKGYGRLECCPVLPNMEAMPIPQGAIADRIGYIAVHLNADLTEAELWGFVPSLKDEWIEADQVPFSALRSLDTLPGYFAQMELESTPVFSTAIAQLSEWVNNRIDESWRTLESILDKLQERSSTHSLAYSFRQPLSASTDHQLKPDHIKRGKFLTLGEQPGEDLLFIVGVKPSSSSPEMNITIEVYPFETQPYLPEPIKLAVMDETGKAVLQAEGGNSEGLEFQFSGEIGERFSVEVSVPGHQIVEQFQI